MEVLVTSVDEVKKTAEIVASPEEIKPHIEKAYEEFRSKAEIKGFRKGKAPLSLIKKMYGDEIENDAVSDIVNSLYNQAVKENEIRPIGEPVLTDIDYKPGEHLKFSVRYEVLPQIELKDYKNIKVDKPIFKVREEEVEQQLQRIREEHATEKEVEKVTDKFHIVTIDVQELDDSGVPIIGKRTQDTPINLFRGGYDEEFITPLLGAEKGSEYVIRYEKEHEDHSHKIHVKVTVKNIVKVELPEITDEFVTEKFKDKFSSVEELRNDIARQIKEYYNKESTRIVRNRIVDEIVRNHDIPVPDSLLNLIYENMLNELKNRFPDKKLPADFDRNTFESERRAEAIWQAKWHILKEKLAEVENITVADDDIQQQAKEDSGLYGLKEEQLIEIYRGSDSLQDRILINKLVDKLESYAQITETEEPSSQKITH